MKRRTPSHSRSISSGTAKSMPHRPTRVPAVRSAPAVIRSRIWEDASLTESFKQPAGEDQQPEAEEVRRREHARGAGEPAVADELLQPPPSAEGVPRDQHDALVETVDDVARLETVPAPHEAHREEERGHVRPPGAAAEPPPARGGQHEPHVDVVAEPPGERDVPAVPHLAEAAAQKRRVEVLGHVDAEESPDADREGAVAREVEEEVRAERVHVLDRGERS